MNRFFQAVVKMREAQKRYFRVRSATALTEAKEAEDAVDRMIREQRAAVDHPLLAQGIELVATPFTDDRIRLHPTPNLAPRQEPQA